MKYKKKCLILQPKALERLRNYPWPGNIRELQHTIEKAVILCNGSEIEQEDLNLSQPLQAFSQEPMTLEEMGKKMIVKELSSNRQTLGTTAKNLGISRTTLYKKMQKYGL